MQVAHQSQMKSLKANQRKKKQIPASHWIHVVSMRINKQSKSKKPACEENSSTCLQKKSPSLEPSGQFLWEGEIFNINDRIEIVGEKQNIIKYKNETFKTNDKIILKHADIGKQHYKSGYLDDIDALQIVVIDQFGIVDTIFVWHSFYFTCFSFWVHFVW